MTNRKVVVSVVATIGVAVIAVLGPRYPIVIALVPVAMLALVRRRPRVAKEDRPLAQAKLDVCPRCGKTMLARDLDQSGVRHCWACGADVTAAGVTEGI